MIILMLDPLAGGRGHGQEVAAFTNGVLAVNIAKAPEMKEKTKKVEVKTEQR